MRRMQASARSGPDVGDSDSRPTLKVAAVARRLGVAPATLRTWARRYGIGPPSHTAGEHRQYTAKDLARLVMMRRLTLEGVAPAEAARIALTTAVDDAARVGPAIGGAAASGPSEDAGRAAVLHRLPLRSSETHQDAGAERVLTPAPPVDLHGHLLDQPIEVRRLLFAARDLNVARCTEQLTQLMTAQGVVRAWEDVAAPALRTVGDYWRATGDGCAEEHVLTQGISAALHHSGAAPVEGASGVALLACAEEEQHTLPLLALSSALAERRVATLLLGARVPADVLVRVVTRRRPRAVVVFAATTVPAAQLPAMVEIEGTTRLVAGGPGWRGLAIPDGAVHAPSLGAAVDQVRLAVRH
jgi:DNA-binding transcriptional MerR regulator